MNAGNMLLVISILLFFRFQFVAALSLQGTNVLVTGSAGGIGKGIAVELAKENGANVVLHYHQRRAEAEQLQLELGDNACLGILQCDFRKPATLPDFIAQVHQLCQEKTGQGLNILVNNAGVVSKMALEDDSDELSTWHETFAVNLIAPYLLSKLAMRESGGDLRTILHVSSIHGDRSNEYMGAYAASKAALDSLTRTMAIEFASTNVRVNGIAPGVVPVERTAAAFAYDAMRKSWEERIPLGLTGCVKEIAQACIPLLTNDWITGTVLQVDGGMMARANMPLRDRPPRLTSS